jgi:competence protein ComEA
LPVLRNLPAVIGLSFAAAAFAAADVNTATRAELEAVSGVGPGIAETILDERKKGAFKDWGDFVRRVKGVNQRRAARLSAAGLTVSGAPLKPGAGDPAK